MSNLYKILEDLRYKNRINELTDDQVSLITRADAWVKKGNDYTVDWEKVRKFQRDNPINTKSKSSKSKTKKKINTQDESKYTEDNGYFTDYRKMKKVLDTMPKSDTEGSEYDVAVVNGKPFYHIKGN